MRCRNATRRRSSSVKMTAPLATCNLMSSCDSPSYFPPIYAWVFQVVSFRQVSPQTLYTRLLSSIRATYPAHLILLYFITQTMLSYQYRSLSSSLCSFLHSPVISSLLGPNIFLSTLFSNTLSLRSSLSMSDQVSHP